MTEFNRYEHHRAETEQPHQQLLDTVLEHINETDREVATEAVQSLVATVGFDQAQSWMEHAIKRSNYRLFVDLASFTPEGYAAGCELFTRDRFHQLIETKGLQIAGYPRETWQRAGHLLRDNENFDKLIHLLTYSFSRLWMDNLDLLEERRKFVAEDEQDILFNHPETASLLVHDGRRRDWARYYRSDRQDVVGLTHDHEPVITPERWEAWRTYFGKNWHQFLENGPRASMLESTDPADLTKLDPLIDRLRERLLEPHDVDNLSYIIEQLENLPIPTLIDSGFAQATRHLSLEKIISGLSMLTTTRMKEAFKEIAPKLTQQELQELFARGFVLNEILSAYAARPLLQGELMGHLETWRQINAFIASHPELQSACEHYPDIRPYLQLRLEQCFRKKLSVGVCERSANDVLNVFRGEDRIEYEAGKVPSIGVEIEVMNGTRIRHKNRADFVMSAVLGIENGRDEQWEFTTSASNPGIQARQVSELIHGDWLEKPFLEHGQYSMHVNIGIPDRIHLDRDGDEVAFVANALVAGYGDRERLKSGAYGQAWCLQPFEDEGLNPPSNIRPTVDGTHYHGRIELRAFSVEHDTIYRLIHDTPVLMACWYASQVTDRDERDEELARIWKQFETSVQAVFEEHNIQIVSDPDPQLLLELLEVQPQVKSRIREATRKARRILRKQTDTVAMQQAA